MELQMVSIGSNLSAMEIGKHTSRVRIVEFDVGKDSPILQGHDGFHDTGEGCSAFTMPKIGLSLYFICYLMYTRPGGFVTT